MVLGKATRLGRITSSGKIVCIPLDHGLSSGPIRGLESIEETIRSVERGRATSILAQKGVFKALKEPLSIGTIVHLSGGTELSTAPNRKVQVGGVEGALRLGADAVSVHINIGSDDEHEMLEQFGRIADSCDEWGMPLVAMMYPRGKNISDPHDPKILSHVARIGAELGADIVKTLYTGDPESFASVVDSCPVPIAIAGGPRTETDSGALEVIRDALSVGAIGVTYGRNVFQHASPELMTRAISSIVLDNATVDDALMVINGDRER